MKKIISIILTCCLLTVFALTFRFNVSAATKTADDAGQYNYTTESEEIKNLSNSVQYIKNSGFTTRSSKNYEQNVHILSADLTSNEDVKVVTWGIKNSTNTGFTRNTLIELARDYEAKHPGWIVLGGVNSDQYYTKFGGNLGVDGSHYFYPQSYYPMISEGENWFSISPYASCNNVVGFKNDDSLNQMVYGNRSIAGLKIHILDEKKNIINTFDVNDLNIFRELNSGETTIIAPTKDTTVDKWKTVTKSSNNEFFVIENSDLSYVSNSVEYVSSTPGVNVNAFFGKGKITKITNSISLTGNQFAIETTNATIKAALSVGTYVRCEYEFDSGFNGIDEASGFHTVQRLNGKDQNVANSYNSRPYPRSVFGFDSTSGKVFLITCEGKNSSPTTGLYAQEVNALCKQYNITDAFQQDGGGSVTSVYRDESGVLQYSHPSVEGSYRAIAAGLFIVMKVPNIKVETETIYSDKLVINLDDSLEETKYEKMYLELEVDGKTSLYEAVDNQVTILNLASKTEYKYVLWLKRPGEEMFKTAVQGVLATCKKTPVVSEVNYSETDEKIIVEVKFDDPDNAITRVDLLINGKSYFVVVKEKVGKLELDKSVNNFLDIKVEVAYTPITMKETMVIEEFELNVSSKLYIENIYSILDEFIDSILK